MASEQLQLAFWRQLTVPQYEAACVWTIALLALHAALSCVKDEYGQKIVFDAIINNEGDKNHKTTHRKLLDSINRQVTHEKVRQVLIAIFTDDPKNTPCLALTDLLQRVRVIRSLTGNVVRQSEQLKYLDPSSDSVIQMSGANDLSRENGDQQPSSPHPPHLRTHPNYAEKQQQYVQSLIDSCAQQEYRTKGPKNNYYYDQPDVENFVCRIYPTTKHVELSGHNDFVYSVAFSPDGKLLASGSLDKTIKLWSVDAPSQALATLHLHTQGVLCVAFSPDGTLLASSSYNNKIKLCRVEAPHTEVAALLGHTCGVNSVAFSPDSKLLASGGDDFPVRIWCVNTHKEVARLQGHTYRVLSVAFSTDGKLLASGSTDNIVKLWSVRAQREIARLLGHIEYVHSVAFSADGNVLASGSVDGKVKLWSLNAPYREVATLRGDNSKVYSVAISPDSKYLAAGNGYRGFAITVWSLEMQQQVDVLQVNQHTIHSVAFSPDGKFMASGGTDKLVKIWGVE